MKLSVVIAARNEADVYNTVKSIRDTAGDRPEIILIDDCSAMPLQLNDSNARVIHNPMPCGCGPSRHIGALYASGEFILLVDAHSRFIPGWYEAAVHRIEGRPMTLHCATCLGLDAQHMDVTSPQGEYHGATLNIFGPDKNAPGKMQVLEPIWGPHVADDAELPCCMGAVYFLPRAWFLKLNALPNLKIWGGDELMLSLKCWLAGGDIRYLEPVRIGHKFYAGTDRQRFNIPPGFITYNKMFSIETLVTGGLQTRLLELHKKHTEPNEWQAAHRLWAANYSEFAVEQAYNRQLFKHDFQWLCQRFGLEIPR